MTGNLRERSYVIFEHKEEIRAIDKSAIREFCGRCSNIEGYTKCKSLSEQEQALRVFQKECDARPQ